MSRRRRLATSDWQRQLLAELGELVSGHPQDIKVVDGPTVDDQDVVLTIRLGTSGIDVCAGGLELGDTEDFIIRLGPSPLIPPRVEVDHFRFLDFPHVLEGRRLCVYLDPSREWQQAEGLTGFLNRLWAWLEDAAGGRFDAATAMYHAVGGVLHRTPGLPTIVVREEGPTKAMQSAYVLERTPYRSDLTYQNAPGGLRAPVVTLSSGLPFGATRHLGTLLKILDDPYLDVRRGGSPRTLPQSPAFFRRLLASASRNPDGSPQYFVFAVPHPAGGPKHLLGGRLTAEASDAMRAMTRKHRIEDLDAQSVEQDLEVQWCAMSDERPAVTTRRDERRPARGFLGRSIHVWGCGGLGSWIAEFIARAGASAITVCDPGLVTGGLLVRQDYVEDDIGMKKADALGRRLEAIRDDLTVVVETNPLPEYDDALLSVDLIVDATISSSIATIFDVLAGDKRRQGFLAQVATDARSGTLGIANVCAAGGRLTTSVIDAKAGEQVLSRGDLESFHLLWEDDAEDKGSLVPTRGCSVPTFHGSAADLAGVSAALTNVIGSHLLSTGGVAASGTHLIALPHSGSGPPHIFLPIGADDYASTEAR